MTSLSWQVIIYNKYQLTSMKTQHFPMKVDIAKVMTN